MRSWFNIKPDTVLARERPALVRYGVTALMVALAAMATWAVPLLGERAVFLCFNFAVLQAALWFGWQAGLVAGILSLATLNALFLLPVWQSDPLSAFLLNASFGIFASLISLSVGSYRRVALTLRKREKDLIRAQAVGQIGSWRLNFRRDELHWSDENYRIFGVPKGTPMTYKNFLATVHAHDRDYVDRMWRAALGGWPYDLEHRIVANGKVKWVRERAELEFAADGTMVAAFGTTQDITDRKQAELALAGSQQRLAGILESAMDAIISVDAEQRILMFNRAAEKMFRCSAAGVVGTSIERFIPERYRPSHSSGSYAFSRDGSRSRRMGDTRAVTGVRADGEEFPLEASVSQVEIDGRKLFTVILRDVTERVQAERVLRERVELQDRLAKIASTVPGVIYSYRLRPDGSACMPYVSAAFEELYGLKPEAVVDDVGPVVARIHPDDVGRMQETVVESARTMGPWGHAFRYRHPVKGEIWLECHSMPVQDRRDPESGILWHGYVQDISARKRAEEALRESEERYRSLVEQAVDGIFVSDAQGHFVDVNSAGAAMLGYDRGEILQLSQGDVVAAHEVPRIAPEVAKFSRGGVVRSEWRLRRKDGSIFIGEVMGRQLADGRVQAIVRDISEHKEIEAKLREQAEQLRQADRRKDEFLAMLAHELRNPLAPLRNAAHILGAVSPTDTQFQWARDVIARQIAHMGRLVDDLLDVSRIAYGKIELQLEPLVLATVVERAVEASRPLIEARRQRLELALPEQPVHLLGDAIRLAQVIANLLNNAAKYTDVGGNIRLSAEQKGGDVVLRVRDSGQGIAAELLPHIFDPFIQGERGLDRAQGGLGVGLALVKSLVELHGGSVQAWSGGLGMGSEFVVRLPAAAVTVTSAQPAPVILQPTAPYSILVVDDNADAAESLAMLLRLQGYEVSIAANGPAALAAACSLRPRVIFLDIGLPGMNGFEVAQRMRAREETRHACLIAMTGYGQAEDRQRSKEAGFDHHLVKPVDHEVLAALLQAVTVQEPSEAEELVR